ncbi:MAG: helix-turn-helix domain-containing protein [Albidovulum sp.]|nr:helix-turn-helix domain-containing protein [Albidovulum sp.]
MRDAGECSISDLAELFSVSRPTVYRTLNRRRSPRSVIPRSDGAGPLTVCSQGSPPQLPFALDND